MRQTSRSGDAKVVGAGLITLDLIVADLSARQFWHRAGGTCANILAILSQFGFRTEAVARIGRDVPGDILLKDLKAAGVGRRLVLRDEEVRTSRIAELLHPTRAETHRFVFSCPLCGRPLPRNGSPTVSQANQAVGELCNTDLFLFDRVSDTILIMAAEAKRLGVTVVFEPAKLGTSSRFFRAVALSDIVKYSKRRLRRTFDEMLDWVKVGPRLVIETLEDRGLRYRVLTRDGSLGEWIHQEPYGSDHIVDSAGAGDWCSAGFIATFLSSPASQRWKEDSIRSALAFGQAVAAASVAFVGPRGYLEAASLKEITRAAALTMRCGRVPNSVEAKPGNLPGRILPTRDEGDRCSLCLQDTRQSSRLSPKSLQRL